MPAGTLLKDSLDECHESVYTQITQPQRVLVVPRYFIHHWLPLLGPSPAWLVLAFRQAAFVARAQTPEVVRPLPVRQLQRWSGLSHGQVWNLLTQPGYLDWFVRKVASPDARRESTVWGVQVAIPLAPHHLRALATRIDAAPPETDLPQFLRSLMNDLPSALELATPDPTSSTLEFRTLHDLVQAAFGPLDSTTSRLCDEITGRIVQPGNTVAISHYFLDRWRPALKSGESWLVFLLRTHIYSTGKPTSTLFVEGGKTHLATMLGVTTRSVRRWMADLASSPLRHFLAIEDQENPSDGLALEINIQDPIHPDDEPAYQELLLHLTSQPDKNGHPPGQNQTNSRTKPDNAPDNSKQTPRQNWTRPQTILDNPPEIPKQPPGNSWTPPQTKLDTLIGFNPSESNPKSIDFNPPPQLAARAREQARGPVGVGGWDFEQILQIGGVAPEKRVKIARECAENPVLLRQFIGWLLYGYENRQAPGQRLGITSPVLFAVSRYAHSQPAPLYWATAAESPELLGRWMQNSFTPGLNANAQRLLATLEKNGFRELLPAEDPDPDEFPVPEELPAPTNATGPPPLRGTPENPRAPRANPPFPKSAEELWSGLAARLDLPTAPGIVSMWLKDTDLELSLLRGESLRELEACLQGRETEIEAEYPGCRVILRLLRISPAVQNGLPGVEVAEEVRIGGAA